MALICNTAEQRLTGPSPDGYWDDLYRKNENFIETGSAYFSQAYAEALGLVSDIELHNLEQAQLRLGSIAALLGHSIEQYKTSLDIDDRSGLGEHHETTLRSLGLDLGGTEQALRAGRTRGYIAADDQFIHRFSVLFHEQGYRALMDYYLARVNGIQALVKTDSTEPIADWQALTWQLTSAFAEAMMFGQCIAVMNAVAYR